MKSSTKIQNDGATGVITHHVRNGQEANYEQWLAKIVPLCEASVGHLDAQIIRPIPGLTSTFTVLLRFDTHGNLLKWLNSPIRKQLIEEVSPLLEKEDKFYTKSGLDFLFAPQGGSVKVPTRWKQFLVTWMAIYPVSLFSQSVFIPAMKTIGFPEDRYLRTFILSGIIVYLMVYVIMPRFTKLLQQWLYQ